MPMGPKSSMVGTMPRPKRWCQMRLAATRAVSGFSLETTCRARSRRPDELVGGGPFSPPKAVRNLGGISSPRFLWEPRMWMKADSGVPSATQRMAAGSWDGVGDFFGFRRLAYEMAVGVVLEINRFGIGREDGIDAGGVVSCEEGFDGDGTGPGSVISK